MKAKRKLKLVVLRDDVIPAFAAWLPGTLKERHGVILLNLEAHFGHLVDPDNKTSWMSMGDRREILVESLMHEFGHAMEQFFGLKCNEKRMERFTESWRKWRKEQPKCKHR